jgi:hypothetical protein
LVVRIVEEDHSFAAQSRSGRRVLAQDFIGARERRGRT